MIRFNKLYFLWNSFPSSFAFQNLKIRNIFQKKSTNSFTKKSKELCSQLKCSKKVANPAWLLNFRYESKRDWGWSSKKAQTYLDFCYLSRNIFWRLSHTVDRRGGWGIMHNPLGRFFSKALLKADSFQPKTLPSEGKSLTLHLWKGILFTRAIDVKKRLNKCTKWFKIAE